jgi:hypothetical protein
VSRRLVTHFASAPGFLRLVFGFLFQLAHFFNGLENQDLIDSGITGIPQALLGRLNLLSAHGRSGAITIWDRDVAVVGRVSEIDFPQVARIDTKCELAWMLGVFGVARNESKAAEHRPRSKCIRSRHRILE